MTTFSPTPGDKTYDEKTKSLKVELAHCHTLFSSQGATVDKAFVYDRANLDRLQAYVACTRHRLDIEIHVDRESLAEKIVTPDKWRHPSKLSEDEIFKNIAQRWNFTEDKQSTYDLLTSAETKAADYERLRVENAEIIANAQRGYEADRIYKEFQERRSAQTPVQAPAREAANELIFATTPEYTYEQLQSVRRLAVRQPDASEIGRDTTSDTLAGVRDLSSVGMVQHQNRTQELLHENAPNFVELDGQKDGADHRMRWT